MTTLIMTFALALAAVFLGVLLAFVPLRLLLEAVSRSVVEPVRQFIQRQRDRRELPRATPDRRRV